MVILVYYLLSQIEDYNIPLNTPYIHCFHNLLVYRKQSGPLETGYTIKFYVKLGGNVTENYFALGLKVSLAQDFERCQRGGE